ncbi:MAG: AtpZ/AtpI family protein [Elusimicrobiales bacterium]|nr:AtpZ/AtpI family protein [Elusimicrobiales bacterium]
MAEKENWWDYAQIGLELAGAVLLGLWLGYWLDGRLGTRPWLTLAGALLGLVGGFYRVAKELFRPPPAGGAK